MNCHYCDQPCETRSNETRTCKPCNVEYYRQYVNLACELNGFEYVLQLVFEHTDAPARIIKKRIGSTWDMELILNIPVMPLNVNPWNVKDKIKMYLLFS